uniref:Uncharacterized protein n=1 Tax=Strigamia maritima TaxID=126957 RepID=T1JAW0_STRMM
MTLGHISRTGLAQEDSCPDQAPRFVSLSRSGANRSLSLHFFHLSVSLGALGLFRGCVPVEALCGSLFSSFRYREPCSFCGVAGRPGEDGTSWMNQVST